MMLLWLAALPGLLASVAALISLLRPRTMTSNGTGKKLVQPLLAVASPPARPEATPAKPAAEPSPLPILQLQAQLAEVFAAERAKGIVVGSSQCCESAARLQQTVRQLIQDYLASGHDDWKEYVAWNDHHYVRNLVAANDDFELMVICWRYGQGSRVHNHAESHCWLSVLQGCVHELQYKMPCDGEVSAATPTAPPELPGVLGASAPCPRLCHIGTNELQVSQTGYINDHIALHAVRVPEHCAGAGAVTLHLYAPPIRRVKLYEPDNDRVVQRQPGFFTVGLGERRQQLRELAQRAQQGTAGVGGKVGPAGAAAVPLVASAGPASEGEVFSWEI